MKRILAGLLLVFATCTLSFGQMGYRSSVYKITGQVAGLPDGELFLVAYNGITTDTLARTMSMSGNFLFAGKMEGVVMASVITAGQQVLASMMLENAEYSVMGQNLVVGGGSSQKLLSMFNQLDTDMVQERKRLEAQYVEAEKKKDKKKMTAVDVRFQKFLADAQTKELELLQQYADTYVAAYIVASTMRDISLEKLSMRYDLLGKHAKETTYGRAIAKQIERYKQLEIGAVAPDFPIGNETLHTSKGKVKVINFWASWSAPCRKENVTLLRLHEQYFLKGLEIISVSIDEDRQAWKKAVVEDGIGEWKHVADFKGENSEMMLKYCLQTIPYIYVLDADNNIVAKGLRGEALHKKVVELMKK